MVSSMQPKAFVLLGILVIYWTSTQALLNPSSSWLDSIKQQLVEFRAKLDQCERQIGKNFFCCCNIYAQD